MMFNLFHGILPIQLQRFSKYLSVHSTRQKKSFVMVQVRTNLKAMCLSVYGVKLCKYIIIRNVSKTFPITLLDYITCIVANQLFTQPFSQSTIL